MTTELSGIGIYESALRFGGAAEAADRAAEIESLGFSAAWFPDTGGDVFGAMQSLLAATKQIPVGVGVLNLWLHEAKDCATRFEQLSGPDRSRAIVGIGTSHAAYVDVDEAPRYRRPLSRMREYLDDLDSGPSKLPESSRVLAALGPKMLELARERSAGAHTYLVAPEHTALARSILGPGPKLYPEQGVVLESDPEKARAIARQNIGLYFDLPNYVNNWLRLGFTEDDVQAPGSDRLVDALVVWGDESTILKRIRAHQDAGADHVCIQVMIDRPDMTVFPVEQWRRLAPALTASG